MRIKRLELENFRGFKKASLDFPSGNLAVFFGWNGAGKTAVLDAIAIVLRSIIHRNIPFGLGWKDDDIQVGEKKSVIRANYILLGNVKQFSTQLSLAGSPDWTTSPELSAAESPFSHRSNKTNLPLLAYYKTNRDLYTYNAIKPTSVAIDPHSGRTSVYNYSIDAGLNTFSDFLEWFRYEEDVENQQKIEKSDLKYQNPKLAAIRQGIAQFLSKLDNRAVFSALKVKRESNGQEIDFSEPSKKFDLSIEKGGENLKLSQLSSGERAVLLLVADISRRVSILNPHLDSPLESEGVVLIDEIEQHLHPRWQRAVIPALQATFPNIQFIIATHSPQVLSQVENGSVFEIDNFEICPRPTYGRDNNWLLHVIMEDEERPVEVQSKLEEYFALIRAGRLEDAAKKRVQLEQKIGTDDPEFAKADVLLRKKERSTAS